MNNFFKNLDFNLIIDEINSFLFSKRLKEKGEDNFKILTHNEITNSFKIISHMKKAILNVGLFPFSNEYDIKNILEKIEKGYILNCFDLLNIKYEILASKNIRTLLNSLRKESDDYSYLIKLFEEIFPHSYILEKIEKTIDEFGNFKPTASKTYKDLTDKINILDEKINQILNKLKDENIKYLLNKNIQLKENKKTLLIKSSYKNVIDGDIISSSNTNGGYFIEPNKTRKINQEINILKEDLKKEENRLLKETTIIIKKDLLTLYKNQLYFEEIDLIYAKAKYSITHNCNEVIISKNKEIMLYEISHPLVKDAVEIDFIFDENKDVFLITGPNAGGKTAAIKSVGLIILMAKYGLHLPCSSKSSIFLFDNIFTDIGDHQSITQSLSTFSSHIKNINKIIKNATYNDLVILDEIGSGTDPIEGSALAISIIDYFISKRIKLILTSHYSDLKKYIYNLNSSKCASVSFDINNLLPLYRLYYDIIGSSCAIMISERLELDKSIILNAKKILNNIKDKKDVEIENIARKNTELKNLEDILKSRESTLIKKEEELENNIKKYKIELDKKYKDMESSLKIEYEKSIKLLNDKIKELDKKNTIPEIASAKYLLKSNIIPNENNIRNTIFKIGDRVKVIPHNKIGKIIDIKKGKYLVDLGNIKLNYDGCEIVLSDDIKKEIKPLKKKNNANNDIKPYETITIDLRGFRYDEVSDMLDKKISDALLINQTYIKIITGHGSGAVRNACLEYIKKNTIIKKHRFGNASEGLNGCIIIYL